MNGEMSFVGPMAERLELHSELETHIPFFRERYLVKPGITGWAQIKYGYTQSIEDNIERIQYDLYYVKNRSFALDLEILLKTLDVIFGGGGN
jgi:lipopolysaccharide/colanic/teichoic acid biosynthesis glycosyltransferase